MIRKVVLASLMTVCSTVAIAGSHTWDFRNNHAINASGFGSTVTITNGGGMDVELSAWSSTGGHHNPSTCGSQAVLGFNGTVVGHDNDSCIEQATLKSYGGGLGVLNKDERDNNPNHSIDNIVDDRFQDPYNDVDFDMVLFSFDKAVKLTSFNQGWQGHDSDASILAYTGSGSFNSSSFTSTHKGWADILTEGWDVVDNLSGGEGDAHRDFAVDDTNVFSKHWLVGAYNNVFGNGWSSANDAFKLAGLTVVKKPDDPTDGSVSVNAPAMAGTLFAVLAIMAFRRK